MRPLEGHHASGIELLEEVLEERASGVHAAVLGVELQTRMIVHPFSGDRKEPVIKTVAEFSGKVLRQFDFQMTMAGLSGEGDDLSKIFLPTGEPQRGFRYQCCGSRRYKGGINAQGLANCNLTIG